MDISRKGSEKWMLFDYEPQSMKTTHMRVMADGSMQFKETIPMWLARAHMERNKQRAKDFTENGGWSRAKQGAVVADIPDHVDKVFKEKAGFNPLKSGWYDRDKYNSFLDDSDYANFRTGGGKIGKRMADTPMRSSMAAKLKAKPLPMPKIIGIT